MNPREKQLVLKQKVMRNSTFSRREVMKTSSIAPKITIDDVFLQQLDYILNLSAAGKRTNKSWTGMRRKLKEAGYWKKSYNK